MIDLMNEPEILGSDKSKPQILNGNNYVENAHLAIGFVSRCWAEENGKGNEALRTVNELCAYMRLLKEGNAE